MKKKNRLRKWIRRIVVGFLIFIIVFVAAAIILPIVFKKDIENYVKKAANEQLNAEVDFETTSMSLLFTFPNFSFNIKKLTITGKDEFEGLKLADIEDLGLRLNLWNVIGGDYTINSLVVDQPKFYVKVLNNGKANYDIMKPDSSATTEESSESTEFKAKLSYYAINNADIVYDDAPNNVFLDIKNMTHTGTGDLTASTFDFFTKTTMDALTFKYDRIAYLNQTKVDAKINVGVDLEKMAFTLMDNSIKLNALALNAEGAIEMPGSDIKFNKLTLSSPTNTFAAVLSMIPAAYTQDFANVKTKGSFNLSANVNGVYNATSYPSFVVDLGVADAEFQYPDLPLGVKDIASKIKVTSPSSDLDKMVVDVSKFHMKLGNNPFDATLKLKNPMSDPDIKTDVDGKIDLGELSKAFPMEGTSMMGLIEAKLKADTKMSYVEKQEYDKVDLEGLLAISKMLYITKGMPKVNIKNMRMDFTPNNVNLEDLDIEIGKSDIKAAGKLDNLLTYFSRDKIMTGQLTVRSKLLDLDEMMGSSDSTTTTDEAAATNMVDTTSATTSGEVFDQWDFSADFACDKMVYDVYTIKNMKAQGAFSPSRAALKNFEMLIGKVDLQADGQLDNVFGYLYDNEVLKGSLNLRSNYMNLNQFMTEEGEATEPEPAPAPADPSKVESEYEPIIVPDNINFQLNGAFKTLIYDTYKLKNVLAELRVKDSRVTIVNMSANAFGGRIAMDGYYDTKNPEEPLFAFGYDMAQMDFQQISEQVTILEYFAPVMKSLVGRFNSDFKVTGILDKNLYPKLGSLDAKGFLETFSASLKGFTPLKGLSDKMKVKGLEKLSLENTKNFFEIKDGKFILQPFEFKQGDINMIFGGSHGLDQKMAYDLKMQVPRKMLESNAAGQAAGAGLKALQGQASKLGIKMDEAEFLNFGVDVGGTLSKPTFKPKLLGAEGKSGQSLGDQVKESFKEQANKAKEEAEAKIKEEAEKHRKELEERAKKELEQKQKELEERARKEAERRAREAANAVEAKRIQDSIKAATEAAKQKLIDEQKEKLKNKFPKIKNPFGGGK